MTEPTYPRPVDPAELDFERIVYEKAPPRATIRLNRPEVLNAFDFLMLREISRACEDASWDDDVRVVVVTGTGRAFCVGADLRSWGEDLLGNSREYWKWFGAFKDMHDRLREVGKPTIARVNGITPSPATLKMPASPERSRTSTSAPGENPHGNGVDGQLGSTSGRSCGESPDTSSDVVVCDAVVGTEMTVIASVRNAPAGSAPSLYGRTGEV